MNPGLKSWIVVLCLSIAAHLALVVGFKPLSEGFQEPPAGPAISVEASLAGIMGQISNAEVVSEDATETVEPTETETTSEPEQPPEPTPDTAESVKPPETASLVEPPKTMQETPAEEAKAAPTSETTPIEAKQSETRSVAEELSSVETAPAEAQTTTEVPVAAVQSATASPMEELDAARQVEAAPVPVEDTASPEPAEAQPVEEEPKAKKPITKKPTKSPKPKPKKRAARTPPGNNRQGNAGTQRAGQRGAARASSGSILSYAARVRARILGNRPGAAGRGRVVVSFGLTTSGGLRYARIARSSGNSSVDRAALSAVRRSSPFPRPPRGASSGQLRFSIPFHFR